MQCNVCNVFNVLAAGDKRSLGPGLLRWRPSVFTRDRSVSGESAGSRVTVSSITSTTSSLADSTIMAGGNILQQESNDYSKTFITLHFDIAMNAMQCAVKCIVCCFEFFLLLFEAKYWVLYEGVRRLVSASRPRVQEADVWPRDRNLGSGSEQWPGLPRAQASQEVRTEIPDSLLITWESLTASWSPWRVWQPPDHLIYVLLCSSCPENDHKQQEKKEKIVKWHLLQSLFNLFCWWLIDQFDGK